jgi:hypothetical protein
MGGRSVKPRRGADDNLKSVANHRQEDGGMKSRKLLFAVLTSALILVAGKYLPDASLGEIVMGLVSVCGIYVGGNAAARWISSSHAAGVAKAKITADSASAPPAEPAPPPAKPKK